MEAERKGIMDIKVELTQVADGLYQDVRARKKPRMNPTVLSWTMLSLLLHGEGCWRSKCGNAENSVVAGWSLRSRKMTVTGGPSAA